MVGKILGYVMYLIDKFLWSLPIKRITRELNYIKVQKEALMIETLLDMAEHINYKSIEDMTFWAMLLTGFFLVLRKSNLALDTVKKFDANKQFMRGRLKIRGNVILIKIKNTKTHQAGSKYFESLLIAMPQSVLCPIRAIKRMIELLPLPKSDPAFCHADGNPWVYS